MKTSVTDGRCTLSQLHDALMQLVRNPSASIPSNTHYFARQESVVEIGVTHPAAVLFPEVFVRCHVTVVDQTGGRRGLQLRVVEEERLHDVGAGRSVVASHKQAHLRSVRRNPC